MNYIYALVIIITLYQYTIHYYSISYLLLLTVHVKLSLVNNMIEL